jgi:NAD(P)-dependent dehydrogenase (short-subunit alcohol dehydrogenase family)
MLSTLKVAFMIASNAVWLITGCSKGLGRALAEEVLRSGDRVVATARCVQDLDGLVAAHGDAVLPLALDVTDPRQISTVVAVAAERFSGVDVLVNNAGYGYLAAIEEGEDDEVHSLFQTDLFAPTNLAKAVLPAMRARRSGHIVNITSIGGHVSYPGVGYYNMVKAALEAMSDALAQELAPLGIGVTAVAPGAFRTEFRSLSSMRHSSLRIDDYNQTAGKAREGTRAGHGKQAGDPVRAARAIIAALRADKPPVHLLLGSDALDQLRAKLDALRTETDAWEDLTRGTALVPVPNRASLPDPTSSRA